MGDAHEELSTVELRRFDPTPPPRVSFAVWVPEESERGPSITVDGSSARRVYVGKSEACDLKLADPSVSRRHLAIELEGECLRVVDVGSTNGTFVGGMRIRDCLLTGGETIRVGSTTLHVERRSAVAAKLSPATAFGRLRGASREMRRIYPLCERLAATTLPILIEGETGTGKEVLAESLHEASPRASSPFVVLDCTAVAPSLVESVLFGHEKGAFTGAVSRHAGVFEEADGGTLFIDEIGDLDVTMQPKLLRAIERSEIRSVGGSRRLHVDVRIIAATRRNLDAEIEASRFRDDLFHRLAVGRIELPPLRARRGDVSFLAEEFCRQEGTTLSSIPPEVLSTWERASWPGNVRELRNEVARFVALGELSADVATVSGRMAGDFIESVLAADLPIGTARQRVVDDFERRYVERVLATHDGNVSRAAKASGLARRYFQILRAKTKRPV